MTVAADARTTLVISSLTSGGAERVMTTMANAWVKRGRPISLVTVSGSETTPFYPLDPAVNLIPLGKSSPSRTRLRAAKSNASRVLALRSAIASTRPEVVISFLDTTNVRTILATSGSDVPVIVAEHTDPGLKQMSSVWNTLRRLTYPRADRVVVLSQSARDFFPDRVQSRTVILPNPVAIDPPSPGIAYGNRPSITAMGRFGPEKGFDLLIDAFSMISGRFPDWDLVIWGDGELRTDLEAQRDRLGLADRVQFPGRTSIPHDALRQSRIFALSSRREGFPMVLAEALACGMPAVAFNMSSGVSDILRDGKDGLLVPAGDVPGFANALATLMEDAPLRRQMAVNAPDVLCRFGVQTVMDRWDQLISEVTC